MFCGKDEHDHQTTAMGQAQLLTPYTVNSTKRGGTVQYPPRAVQDDASSSSSSDDSDDSCSDDDDDLQERPPQSSNNASTAPNSSSSVVGTNHHQNFRMICPTLDDCPIVEEGDEGESDAEE